MGKQTGSEKKPEVNFLWRSVVCLSNGQKQHSFDIYSGISKGNCIK